MKRYLLFSGSDVCPKGGWHDLKGSYDTVSEALSDAPPIAEDWWRWFHIIDIETGAAVDTSRMPRS